MSKLTELDCDVLIIGGGINGCGIAADAASRGLKVILCEKNNIASATSSASSKLIHGGLRYLEQYNFSLVRKALKEREVLFKICPYLIHPLAFVLPYKKSLRPFWLIRVGLFIYDHLCKTSVPKTQSLSRKKNNKYFKTLNENIKRGFKYYDAKTIDSRLVIVNALQAEKFGAKILTQTKLIKAKRYKDYWQATLYSTNENIQIRTKILVNATGPWADQVNNLLNIKTPYKLSLVQGSHIVVPKLYEGDFAYILQNDDKRIIFAIPYHNEFTLIGTTEHLLKDVPKKIEMTQQEKDYLLSLSNQYFNKTINKKNIKYNYCGLRPLITDKEISSEKNISRDYKIYLDKDQASYICIFGGKLTTYRLLAKECVDQWQNIFPNMKLCQTKKLNLPGADFKSVKQLQNDLHNKYSKLPTELLNYYSLTYGSRTFNILNNSTVINCLGIKFTDSLYQIEVDFLIKMEWSKTVEDILWSRTKQGLFISKAQLKQLETYINKTSF